MAVLINFKICDNARECDGIAQCPAGALFWDEGNGRIGIDNEKCISCGICARACPVGAIKVALDKEEYTKLEKEINEDPRKISDLFIDRYGATPIHLGAFVKDSDLDREIGIHTKPLLVELFLDDDLMCLRKSVPIRELIPGEDIVFRKIRVENKEDFAKYDIGEFPCLLFFRNGELVGKIEGYFGEDEKEELIGKVRKMVKIVIGDVGI